MKYRLLSWLVSVSAMLLGVSGASGAVTLSPVRVVGTDLGVAAPSTPPENMINGSGITDPFVSGVTDFDSYFANPGQRFATSGDQGTNNWQSEVSFTLPLKGYVDFDLGAVYKIGKIALWNRSLKNVTLKIREELDGPEQTAGSFTLINRLSFPFSYAADVLDLKAEYQGRYVKLVIESVHTFSASDTFGYAIVGEFVASAAPLSSQGEPPPLSVTLSPTGDVQLTFGGILQSAPAVQGNYSDVPGSPKLTHTLPRASLGAQQFFRTRAD